jgi:hypothetical protein
MSAPCGRSVDRDRNGCAMNKWEKRMVRKKLGNG